MLVCCLEYLWIKQQRKIMGFQYQTHVDNFMNSKSAMSYNHLSWSHGMRFLMKRRRILSYNWMVQSLFQRASSVKIREMIKKEWDPKTWNGKYVGRLNEIKDN